MPAYWCDISNRITLEVPRHLDHEVCCPDQNTRTHNVRSNLARPSTENCFPSNSIYTLSRFQCCAPSLFFQLLRYFAADELERENLDEFVSIEGADEMYGYCQRVKRTTWEVLSEFRSARIPREYVFDLFPSLRPREFSIASSIELHPREIRIRVAIVRYRTKSKIHWKGVCTSYLSGLELGDTLRIGLRRGFISLPTDPNTSVVCGSRDRHRTYACRHRTTHTQGTH
ncbi:hypothetical protein EV424DRAFT_270313 [Suillus variegatus]|nr:hypothetical protein EV424DRAFT_270313 [Suillus variegatus]